MFKRILVGIDTVRPDHAPLWEAVGKLSKQDGAKLVLAHVTEVQPTRFGLLSERHDDVQRILDEATAEIQKHGGVVESAKELRVGIHSPAEALATLAKDHHCDLLALGTHPHGPWSGALLGSVSQRAAHHSPCPVLLVPCG
jgi:nucleotide-binding universal stress UspA family protein